MKTQVILFLLILYTSASVDKKQILSLIKDLNDTNDRVRECATQSLMNMDMTVLPILQELYPNAPYETKRRIKRIVEEIFLSAKAGPGPAFLGIGLEYTGWVIDQRIPADASAIKITSIYRYSAAEAAGIQAGDLIVFIYDKDNKRIDIDMPKWIKSQHPGTHCRAGIIHNGEGISIEQLIIPRFSYEELSKIVPKVILHEDDPRILPDYSGIVVSVNCLLSKICKGDIIISLDNKGLPRKGSEQTFSEWLQNLKEEKHMSFSMQILRGGNFFLADIVLSRPPLFLRDKFGRKPSIKLEDAYAEFDRWWITTFPEEYKERQFWESN